MAGTGCSSPCLADCNPQTAPFQGIFSKQWDSLPALCRRALTAAPTPTAPAPAGGSPGPPGTGRIPCAGPDEDPEGPPAVPEVPPGDQSLRRRGDHLPGQTRPPCRPGPAAEGPQGDGLRRSAGPLRTLYAPGAGVECRVRLPLPFVALYCKGLRNACARGEAEVGLRPLYAPASAVDCRRFTGRFGLGALTIRYPISARNSWPPVP